MIERRTSRRPQYLASLPVANLPLRVQALGILVFSLVLGMILFISPVTAQTSAQISPQEVVVIDGTELFRVGSSGGYAAERRAADINLKLRQAIDAAQDPQVQVSGSPELPIILLNGDHLLTVTNQDTLVGRTNLEQATLWANSLETALEQAQYERTIRYLQSAVLKAVGAVIVALVLHWALGRFWRQKLSPELRAVTFIPDPDAATATTQQTSLDLLLDVLLAIGRVSIWLGAGFYITSLFPWTRQWSYRLVEVLVGSFVTPIFTLGDNQYSVLHLLTLAGFLVALEIATKTITNVVKSKVLRLTVANRGIREVIALVIRYSLLFIGGLVLLQIWGIDLSSLALLASALGLGIGLGLQDIAKDVGSGLVLLFERPIQVGDFVQVGEFEGTIEQIGSRSTLIRTLDHISIIVPNSRFLSSEVINWSHHNPVSRIHVPVGVAYGSDLDKVRSALLEAAKENNKVLSHPQSHVIFKGFGDSSLNLELLIWTAEPSKHILITSELYFSIEAKFRRYNVEVPFPQRDLHLRTGNLPLDLTTQIHDAIQEILRSSNGKSHREG